MTAPGALVADRYRLVRQLGAGGMGVVWEARDERLHRPVAVKRLRTQPGLSDADTDLFAQRAMREARITASLQHPYAVSVFDVVEDQGQPCIVMELVPSVPLSQLVRELGSLSPAEAARVGSQVADALAAAHALGIVHRDIKPSNILIGDDGAAHICDFGISRALGDTTLTMTGMITGTPAYLAPEVARGREASSASDVYSLGATLYSAVEGETPFGTEGSAIAVLYRVTSEAMRPPERAGPLSPLLLAMMSTEPADRPAMAEVAAALSESAVALSDLADGGPAPQPTIAELTAPLPVADRAPDVTQTPVLPLADVPTAPRQLETPAAPSAASAASAPPEAAGASATAAAPATATPARRRRPALIAAIVVAIILAGVAAVALLGPGSKQPTTGSSPGSNAAASPSQTPSPSGEAITDRLAQAVTDYYALLPDDTDAAWELLTRSYQQQAGGRDSYERFWNGIDTVTVTDVRATAPDQVQARLSYVSKSGNQQSTERRTFRLVEADGKLKIDQSSVI